MNWRYDGIERDGVEVLIVLLTVIDPDDSDIIEINETFYNNLEIKIKLKPYCLRHGRHEVHSHTFSSF